MKSFTLRTQGISRLMAEGLIPHTEGRGRREGREGRVGGGSPYRCSVHLGAASHAWKCRTVECISGCALRSYANAGWSFDLSEIVISSVKWAQ